MTKPKATARFEGVKEDSLVSVTLAHPLDKNSKERLGLPEDSETNAGDEIKVRKYDAQSLINAGYTTTDPEDNQAVRATLGEPTSQPSSTSGNTRPTQSGNQAADSDGK
jgi:hypothetical protein